MYGPNKTKEMGERGCQMDKTGLEIYRDLDRSVLHKIMRI